LATLLCGLPVHAQVFRASFDDGANADQAVGRAEPFVSTKVEQVPGKFGNAVRVEGNSLVYAAEGNFPAGRGTVAFWCRVGELPGPLDIQRLIFVQCKERGYWNYLAAIEWQEGAFRAMVFDHYHGHGWHDPQGLPALVANRWHHVALVWDQAHGAKFFLDAKLLGSTWGEQAWWERPSPHAIHLCYPGAEYDELCLYERPLSDAEVVALMEQNQWQLAAAPKPIDEAGRQRLVQSLNAIGMEELPLVEAASAPDKDTDKEPDKETDNETVLRQASVQQILDDKIPSWKVMDGRLDLFWPEWRSPTLGDVDFSGSKLSLSWAPGQAATHLVLRGQLSGCEVFGERDGYVSEAPILKAVSRTEAPASSGLPYLAAARLPSELTGLRIPRQEKMKLQEVAVIARQIRKSPAESDANTTPIAGELDINSLGPLGAQIKARTALHERRVFGKSAATARKAVDVPGLTRIHLVTAPVADALPLDAVSLRVKFVAAWKEDVWWLRIQDPVNPRRDLFQLPVRVVNTAPGKEVTLAVALDHWDIMLDPEARLWVELLPTQAVTVFTGGADPGGVALRAGPAEKVLAEFAHTQSQLAFSYWQLGSEGDGRQGANPDAPSFNLLGGITSNYELKLTLQWLRRHVPDNRLANNLWNITWEKRSPVPVEPRLQPPGAPAWAVWNRELLQRFRDMAHFWADWQGPDGQLGGGWNDDPTFPGVFLCLPLLGDTRTKDMFVRIFDGIEETGYLQNGVCRGPIDTGHARDLVAWRGHLMLFDYGQPRHVERALNMTKELHRWTRLDENGHRRGLTNHISEDGPGRRPRWVFNDDGLIQSSKSDGDFSIVPLSMDPMFCAWYSRNPTVLKFVREVAEGEYARTTKVGGYPFISYYQLLDDPKYVDEPPDQHLLADEEKEALIGRVRAACEVLEGGWQFRGGEARGANDHFTVPGQTELSRMSLGYGLTWSRSAITMIPPIAVSWSGFEDRVAALVLEAGSKRLRVAVYNFDEQPRSVEMRVWRLAAGRYRLQTGIDGDHDDTIDGQAAVRDMDLQRSSSIDLELPPQKVLIVELDQLQSLPRRERLPDLAVGKNDAFYDVATDRLKVVVHNLGAEPARGVTVRFEDPTGALLAQREIPLLEAPLDLEPKTAVVWLPQPLLLPHDRIVVRVDPDGAIDEITDENNRIVWER
jgi:hypothetical protein